MYSAQMCHNSVPGGPTNFILGVNISAYLQLLEYKLVAMATPVA